MAGPTEKGSRVNGDERSIARAWPGVTNVSPVSSDLVAHRQGGVFWATVIVKATFQLAHGETARCVAPLALVSRDEPNSPGGSLARARETAPHVPNSGVVLTGHAHAPHGRAVPSMSVRLGIAREAAVLNKLLHVYGPRIGESPHAITPFRSMPLLYERAFGGAGVVDPRDPGRVAGFGPISGQWAPRRAFLGGINPAALDDAVFEAPPGFDWRYFQAAPADQQIDGIRGDEWIVLDGMHPHFPRVQSRLPCARALAVRRLATGPDQPIDLRADMLVIDADGLLASVVWRGRFALESLGALSTLSVLAGLELPGSRVDWPRRAVMAPTVVFPQNTTLDLGTLIGGAALPFAATDAAPEATIAVSSSRRSPAVSTGTTDIDLAQVLRVIAPFRKSAAPLPIVSPVAAAPPAVPAPPLVVSPPLVIEAPPVVPPPPVAAPPANPDSAALREAVIERVRGKRLLAGLELAGADLRDLDLRGVELKGIDLRNANLSGARLSGADLSGTSLEGASLEQADLSGASLQRAKGKGVNLRGAKLEGADLRQAQLPDALLDDAELRDVSATRANLSGARFFRADLSFANLRAANLGGADFTHAKTEGADLRDAEIAGIQIDPATARLLKLRLPR